MPECLRGILSLFPVVGRRANEHQRDMSHQRDLFSLWRLGYLKEKCSPTVILILAPQYESFPKG